MANWDTEVNISADFGSTKETSIVVREVQFGDGYKKLFNSGLNNDLKKYNFRFRNKRFAIYTRYYLGKSTMYFF